MWTKTQETIDLFTFTKKIFDGKPTFLAVVAPLADNILFKG